MNKMDRVKLVFIDNITWYDKFEIENKIAIVIDGNYVIRGKIHSKCLDNNRVEIMVLINPNLKK